MIRRWIVCSLLYPPQFSIYVLFSDQYLRKYLSPTPTASETSIIGGSCVNRKEMIILVITADRHWTLNNTLNNLMSAQSYIIVCYKPLIICYESVKMMIKITISYSLNLHNKMFGGEMSFVLFTLFIHNSSVNIQRAEYVRMTNMIYLSEQSVWVLNVRKVEVAEISIFSNNTADWVVISKSVCGNDDVQRMKNTVRSAGGARWLKNSSFFFFFFFPDFVSEQKNHFSVRGNKNVHTSLSAVW